MNNIPPLDLEKLLKERIEHLEKQQAEQAIEVRKSLHRAYESIKPSNIVSNMVEELILSDKFTDMVVGSSVGLAAGYISKKLLVGSSDNPFRQLAGSSLMLAVTNLVAQHPDTIKSIGKSVFTFLKSKKDNDSVVDNVQSPSETNKNLFQD